MVRSNTIAGIVHDVLYNLLQFARILLEDGFTMVLVGHSWVFSHVQC